MCFFKLFFSIFSPPFSMQINARCVVKCYFAAASVPQAGALLAALPVCVCTGSACFGCKVRGRAGAEGIKLLHLAWTASCKARTRCCFQKNS